MCAISGYVNFGGENSSHKEGMLSGIQKAVDVMNHRGPDDKGFCAFSFADGVSYVGQDAAELMSYRGLDGVFGFDRLSIKDLSMAGHQPMRACNGKVVIVFNGEIKRDVCLCYRRFEKR